MEYYIAPSTWFCVHILTQDFKTKVKATAEQVLTFFFENYVMPLWNGPVLTISQIIKYFMSSASEAELGALFIAAQEMVAMRNTQEEMKWPHPESPIQTDNSAAAGVLNNTIVPRKFNTMERHLHWIRCRES